MTDKQPTQEQIKEFWEWCGLKWFWNHNPDCRCDAVDNDDSMRSWYYKDGNEWKLATRFWNEPMKVDLSNLFQYAVPKLGHYHLQNTPLKDSKHYARVQSADNKWAEVYANDPALALFWAIYSVIKEEVIKDA